MYNSKANDAQVECSRTNGGVFPKRAPQVLRGGSFPQLREHVDVIQLREDSFLDLRDDYFLPKARPRPTLPPKVDGAIGCGPIWERSVG